jgi:gliding motility-associated-like protein
MWFKNISSKAEGFTYRNVLLLCPWRFKIVFKAVGFFIALLCFKNVVTAQPANDNCANASVVTIGNAGYAMGTFTSTQFNLSSATLQTGETFAPSLTVAGLNKRSIWFKFSLPTQRSVRVNLSQPGSTIQAGNVGFAVYKTNNCVPGNTALSSQLSPIETFGNTYHPCVGSGEYYVQVTSNTEANGPVFISVEIDSAAPAEHDFSNKPGKFGKLGAARTVISTFDVGCQSIDNAAEICTSGSSFEGYNKSTWHTFTTPDFYDYLAILIGESGGVWGSPGYTVGYRLFEGDVEVAGQNGITLVGQCDSLKPSSGYYIDWKYYKCGQLKTNTTYSVQLTYHKDFYKRLILVINWDGYRATRAPLPLNSIPAQNKLGVLNHSVSGVWNMLSDTLSCNARFSQVNCERVAPLAGYKSAQNLNLNLSTFFSFSLATSSTVSFSIPGNSCGYVPNVRLYKTTLVNGCNTFDTASFIPVNSTTIQCLEGGDYVMQVLGVDSIRPKTDLYYGHLYASATNNMCIGYNLGSPVSISMYVKDEVATNKYSLKNATSYEGLHANAQGVLQPLVPYETYRSLIDTFGCANTVLPDDGNNCGGYTKGSFRQFRVTDSAIIVFREVSAYYAAMYKGDAAALAVAQNKFSYPEKLTGLEKITHCISYSQPFLQNSCVTPGTYTLVGLGNQNMLGWANQQVIEIRKPVTRFDKPEKAQDMGNILDSMKKYGSNTLTAAIDTFTCTDNAVLIDGAGSCDINGRKANKLIYRQFYLSTASKITINSSVWPYTWYGHHRMFTGKATEGISGLKQVTGWQCFVTASSGSGQCDVLQPGWYTVVSYGDGASYEKPLMDGTTQSSALGQTNTFQITMTPVCASPKFNRPFKASIDTTSKKPHLIQWGTGTGHTAAYPVTSKYFALPTENLDCTVDTPFMYHVSPACGNIASTGADRPTKVIYYVFETTQSSYLQIRIPSNVWGTVFNLDVRTKDSALLKTTAPIQQCLNTDGHMQFCNLQPGVYTLILFARNDYQCNAITPGIYIDQMGYSRFDHANNAYDFDVVPATNVWTNRKTGETNPLNSSRAPSNDFFYCTTGAQERDPSHAVCMSDYNPRIYNDTVPVVLYPSQDQTNSFYHINRRNLWYTFVIDKPGTVTLKVDNKTPGKQHQLRYAVYKSDVDGNLSFAQVQSGGLVDSTLLQGLELVVQNTNFYYCQGSNEISFYNDPCTFTKTRYYIIVENRNPYAYADIHAMNPNHQIEVSVKVTPTTTVLPKFDYYSTANDMGTIGTGYLKGETDNFSCATRSNPDPVQSYPQCQKTLWYKFTTTTSGYIRYGMVTNKSNYYAVDQIQLFREVIKGDSTSRGLAYMAPTSTPYENSLSRYLSQTCISPGTYYLLLTGCNMVDETVTPDLIILPQAGDYCSAPLVTNLAGPGQKKATLLVDCHTSGTDYGEFNPTLTCPTGAETAKYKTSWYRLDITGNDTLDVTVYIDERTNATSTEINYRMMTGNCGAMQEQSCVQDALTRNTYKCLAPGNSYYIQVFTPIATAAWPYYVITGEIDLNISAVIHQDICNPASNCIAVANFTPEFDCTKDKGVRFVNFSTFGTDISYKWDFGHANQKSNEVSPTYNYPALTTDSNYTVKLIVTNNSCSKTDNITHTVFVPARPSVNLGRDTILCNNGSTLTLNATSHDGSTYAWWNGSTNATVNYSGNGGGKPWVKVTYKNCIATDTIDIWINPIAKKALQTLVLCSVDQVTLNAARGQGELYTWSNGAFAGTLTVSQPGYYWCDLFLNGCTVRDSFYVINQSATQQNKTIIVCQKDMPYEANATVSGASAYKWNDNNSNAIRNIAAPGIWWVDVTISGCTIRDSLTLKVDSFKNVNTAAHICFGQSYTLPSGKIVNTGGTHRDTMRNARGCDTLITRVTLTIETPTTKTLSASIYAGQTYTLPWGTTVTDEGIYRDTVKSIFGCDSAITIVTLTILTRQTEITEVSICHGSSYTLPWGGIVTNAGTYTDTLKTSTGADSLVKIINLAVIAKSIITTDTTVCEGSSFTLHANNAASYQWSPGNDLSATNIRNPVFTANQTRLYTLESTYVVNSNNITCTDSVRVQVLAKIITNFSASICAGKTYTLPGGRVVNSSGIYPDTLRNTIGCDSLITNVNLTVQTSVTNTLSAFICEGQIYTLPSGQTVNATGIYRDTLRYASGCDSAITVVNLTRFNVTTQTESATICLGNAYTLPSGIIVSTAGTYRDTLRYENGCDSIRFTITLSVTDALRNTSTAYICAGNVYTLPSGRTVSTAGLYRDTVRTAAGCDSLISNITVVVDAATVQALTPTICEGVPYTLPSGRTVSLAGNYLDTLRNIRGCDSIRFSVNLSVSANRFGTASATLCAGQVYTRPSGKIATTSGIYLDTIRSSVTGCDSIITTTLTYRVPLSVSLTAPPSVCTGVAATLVATASGGNGGPYTFTWTGATGSGNTITVTPTATTQYKVSVSDGCTILPARDSVTITYVPPPQAGLNNATIVICSGGSTQLTATGGTTYAWSPALGLSNIAIANPVASPLVDTRYRVRVTTAQGCVGEDSIFIRVNQPYTLTASLDTFVCAGGSVPLYAVGAQRYEWTGAGLSATSGENVTVRPTVTTTYTVTGYGPNNCFPQTRNIRVTVIALPTVDAGRDTTIMVGTGFTLQPTYTGANLQYTWTPPQYLSCADCPTPTTRPEEPIEYTINVRNAFGCQGNDRIRIELICNGESVFLPNTFTPNGDGVNDTWYPRGGGIRQVRYLKVFNRWGQIIFERTNFSTDDRNAGWDGSFKGKKLAPDVFVFTMGVTCDNGQNIETRGNVMIVR